MPVTDLIGKCSMHADKIWNRRHNLRSYDKSKWNTDGHINDDLIHLDIVLTDTEPEQFFANEFTEDLLAFNEKELKKHPDRVVGKKYYDEIKKLKIEIKKLDDDEDIRRMYHKIQKLESKLGSNVSNAYYQQHKKDIQEVIFQMSDGDNYRKLCGEVGEEQAREIHEQFLRDCFEMWQEKNPTLKVVSATIHFDEETPHLHLDFVPVAKSDKGLKTKVSMEGALSLIGYERKHDKIPVLDDNGQQKVDAKGKPMWLRDEKGKLIYDDGKYSETPYKKMLTETRKQVEKIGSKYMTVIPSEPTGKGERHQEPWQWKKEEKLKEKGKEILNKFRKDATVKNAQAVIDNLTEVSLAITADVEKSKIKISKAEKALERKSKEVEEEKRKVEQQRLLNEQQRQANERQALLNEQTKKRLATAEAQQELTIQQTVSKQTLSEWSHLASMQATEKANQIYQALFGMTPEQIQAKEVERQKRMVEYDDI